MSAKGIKNSKTIKDFATIAVILIQILLLMLHLVQSNKMEFLAKALQVYMQTGNNSSGNIFAADTILVQSPGMAQWLKIQIAEDTGIAANLDFPLPSSFIWQLYRQHISELPEQSAFTKANMAWKLMAVLPGLLHEPSFAAIADYLADGQALRLYQLCHKIADVYDQYLVYRPEWILSWEQGMDQLPDTQVSEHPWQPALWRALLEYTQSLAESPFHRANLHQSLLSALSAQQHTNNDKPLFVFGISAMPWQQLEVLQALAKQRDVVIFWFNPCQHYWGDVVDELTRSRAKLKQTLDEKQAGQADYLATGNPLLSSWGKLGRDYQDMLLELEPEQHDGFVDPEAHYLLSHIQSEILNLQYRGCNEALSAEELLSNGEEFPKIAIAKDDTSVQIHICHSKVRELEVLHDRLLSLFALNPDWHPGDVIVMMPDVAQYAPFIDGVFGAVEANLRIPYAISDRNVSEQSPLLNSFKQLMTLHQSRLTLSEVLELCEVPAIQARFDISASEYELLGHWLADAGVRWAWDEQDKARWNVPGDQQNTWYFGLQRLLAGYAMTGDTLYHNGEQCIAPYHDIEGQQAIALGKFYLFAKHLREAISFCQQSASLPEKVSGALTIIEQMYLPQDSEEQELMSLRHALEQMLCHQKQYPLAVEHDVFVSELLLNLQDKGVGQRFLAGYVNFCTLMPMRSIPFKVVCLLGLNDADYPRQVLPMGFDLLHQGKARRGDRSRRLDDRYLFLEALLSARDLFYVSYQGFSQKDNSPRSPSILLSELLDYCRHGYCLDGQHELPVEQSEENFLAHLCTAHALQPFSEQYFLPEGPESELSYQLHWLSVAQQLREDVEPLIFLGKANEVCIEMDEDDVELELDQLILFFHNPAKSYFIHHWQSRFGRVDNDLLDEEPFAFDALDRYLLNQRLIEASAKSGQYNSDWITSLRAEGRLPSANSGPILLAPIAKQSEGLIAKLEDLNALPSSRPDSRHEVNIKFAGTTLLGWVDHLYQQNLVMWRPHDKVRARDKLSLYLTWLCLCARPPKTGLNEAIYLGLNSEFRLPVVEPTVAYERLDLFVSHYRQGLRQGLHFYPETAWQWLKTADVNKTLQTFMGSDFVKGEGQEAHIQRICSDLSEHFDEFSRVSEELMGPLFALAGDK
jgi:exodeoxyribonuclease V gamma subunit